MILHIYCCLNDTCVRSSALRTEPNIRFINIRDLLHTPPMDNAVILASNHHTNQRLVSFIRRYTMVIPIFLISHIPKHYKEINGIIHPTELTHTTLKQKISASPNDSMWHLAFQKDQEQKNATLTCG